MVSLKIFIIFVYTIFFSNIASIINYSSFLRKHILSVKEFTRNDLHLLFGVAHEMRTLVERYGTIDLLQGRVMITLFYEPSTRTSASFQAAMYRLGGRVVSINVEASSVMKGETLEDTIRTVGSYGDIIVLRHPENGSAKTAAKFSPVPIINAGDGIGEHPSQVNKLNININQKRDIYLLGFDIIFRPSLTYTQFVKNWEQ